MICPHKSEDTGPPQGKKFDVSATIEPIDRLDDILHNYKTLYEAELKQIALNEQLKQQKHAKLQNQR